MKTRLFQVVWVLSLAELVRSVRDATEAVQRGDLSGMEAMLTAQAIALQTMFASYARRAQEQQYQKHLEAFFGMALKAQAQSRATIQALVELKYPRQVVFAKQANMTNGPQQVNNGASASWSADTTSQPPAARAHGEPEPQQSKLLEDQRNGSTYLDTGATPEATGGHPAVEAVGAVNRTQKRRGKGAGVA